MRQVMPQVLLHRGVAVETEPLGEADDSGRMDASPPGHRSGRQECHLVQVFQNEPGYLALPAC